MSEALGSHAGVAATFCLVRRIWTINTEKAALYCLLRGRRTVEVCGGWSFTTQLAACTTCLHAGGKRPRVETLYRTDKLEALGEALMVLQFARAQVRGAVLCWAGLRRAALGYIALAGLGSSPLLTGQRAQVHTQPLQNDDVYLSAVQASKQARHLTHPQLCLDAIQFGVEHGGRAGLSKVRFTRLASGPLCLAARGPA